MRTKNPVKIELSNGEAIFHSTRNGKRTADIFETKRPHSEPILKWAGGKQWLTPLLNSIISKENYGTYFEPFLGAGSCFFAISPEKAVISDLNEELIGVYEVLKKDVKGLILKMSRFSNNSQTFYRVRAQSPRSEVGKAARLIYLNKTCWNGLYRVNRDGNFNVPFGQHKNPKICDKQKLIEASVRLRSAKIENCDFSKRIRSAKNGDVVYFDPPYITGHQNNGFHMYNSKLFSWEDQLRLSEIGQELKKKRVHVVISNADHEEIKRLYTDFHYYRIFRKSLIGGKNARRGLISEALITNYPLFGIESKVK